MTSQDINRRFVIYLMSCFLYYVDNQSVLSDTEFDGLCKELLLGWDSITHPHKHLTSREDLEAGTGYAIVYPNSVIGAARQWYYEQRPEVLAPRKKSRGRTG